MESVARITNEEIKQYDWARAERQTLLAQLGRGKAPVRHAVTMVSTLDPTAVDPRSVKYQLRGGFSARAAWWRLFSTAHQLLSRAGTLEQAMYGFHRFHHSATIALLEYLEESHALRASILRHGALKAVRSHIDRTKFR